MLIYYINLDVRLQRREFMQSQFADLGLQATRVAAVTPDRIAADLKRKYCNPRNGYWLTEVELACNLSHLAAMRLFLNTKEKYALILEDDVFLSKSLPGFLDGLEQINQSTDIIRIETFLDSVRLLEDKERTVAGFKLMRSISFTGGAAGYVLSRHAAETLVREKDMYYKQSDRVMFNPFERLHDRLRMRHVVPALCVQMDRISANNEQGWHSDLAPARQSRREIESPFKLDRIGHVVLDAFRYEVLGGLRKLALQYAKRVKKMIVPFSAE